MLFRSNCDDHTKNLSFLLLKNGKWSLSPAYDITHAFNPKREWTYQHLMSVNGRFSSISREDLFAVGDRFLVPRFRQVIREVSAAVAAWTDFAKVAVVPKREVAAISADFPKI